jgi:AcrR family transcriptional regulator
MGSAAQRSTDGPRRPGRPRRRVLSRDAIADAVIEVGFENLTLVAVAERLGVTHASLYGNVTDRDDLVIAAADRLIAGAP